MLYLTKKEKRIILTCLGNYQASFTAPANLVLIFSIHCAVAWMEPIRSNN